MEQGLCLAPILFSIMDKIRSLRMEHITKRFPGVLASDDISIDVGEGEVLALVGENGAGKTTLMNILMGLYQPDEGRILINGEPVRFRGPEDAFRAGLGMVHQTYMLVPNMTVTENIALGLGRNLPKRPGHLDLKAVRKRIEKISQRYGLAVNPDAYIWQLSVGEQQKVELVKTLCLGAKFLILDEPTSALTPQEVDELIALLHRMTDELSIIFISHKLQEVKALSNKVTILRHGKVVFSGNTDDYSSQEIAARMTGHEIVLPKNKGTGQKGDVVLSLSDVTVMSDRKIPALNSLTLDVRAGEIVGLAGVSGNGQRELAEVINGLRKVESGSIRFFGNEIANKTPREIIDSGMGYIPEERNTEGIVPPFSIKENFVLKDISSPSFSSWVLVDGKKIDSTAEKLVKRFDVRCPGIDTASGSLSGGNIQKVILAREIERKPKFLVAVYPTRGLDMGAVEFIHSELLKLRESGIGILLISEELDEILDLSDRIAVIYKGSVQRVLDRSEATPDRLGILMAGVQE